MTPDAPVRAMMSRRMVASFGLPCLVRLDPGRNGRSARLAPRRAGTSRRLGGGLRGRQGRLRGVRNVLRRRGLRSRNVLADDRLDDLVDLRSDEHTSELQSLMRTSYAVLCL